MVLINTFSLEWSWLRTICAQRLYYVVQDTDSTKAQPTVKYAYFRVFFVKGKHTWNSHSEHQEKQSKITVNEVTGVLLLLKGRIPGAFRWCFIMHINNRLSPPSLQAGNTGLSERPCVPTCYCNGCSSSLYASPMYKITLLRLTSSRNITQPLVC